MVAALLGLAASSLVLGGSLGTWASVIALLMYVGAYQVLLSAKRAAEQIQQVSVGGLSTLRLSRSLEALRDRQS